jgi:hypothetical protein
MVWVRVPQCTSGAVQTKPFRFPQRVARSEPRPGRLPCPYAEKFGMVVLLVVLLLSPTRAVLAQISPGPLSRAHQSLNGPTNCTTCHKLGAREAIYKCLECHTEIASRIASGHGLHASYGIKAGSSQECSRCHSEHNGENFPLTKWDTRTFDHKQTGYRLEGKHLGLACDRCHMPERIPPAERGTIKMADLRKTFLGVPQACIACHRDEHEGRLGQTCVQCHNFTDWKNTSQFDHSKTRYPLTGLHAQVACKKCHTPAPDGKPRYSGMAFGKCSDCHNDPHKGSFAPQSCQACHGTAGWKVPAAVLGERFDHSRTKYPLVGRHLEVACTLCHVRGDFSKPLAFEKCMDCHKPDPHGGQFANRSDRGECASCHTLDGFKPSTFGLKEHAETAYPLEGGHAKLQCGQCHVPKGKETLYKIKFDQCMDCHMDDHQGQFSGAPYLNRCEQCHTLQGYRPSTFTLARHQQTRFVLTGGHVATPCNECHKPAPNPDTSVVYRFENRSCTICHSDPHRGQFNERMRHADAHRIGGCEACHSTASWRDVARFDHADTEFPLIGAHRATSCIDCHKPPNLETKLTNVDFRTAPKECESCHEDIHGGQFANPQRNTLCNQCHNSNRWKPSDFDHDRRTDFPLEGVHRDVRCADCHKLTRTVNQKIVLFYKPTPKECAACHGPK